MAPEEKDGIPKREQASSIPVFPRHPVIYPEVKGVLGYFRFVFGVQLQNLWWCLDVQGVWLAVKMSIVWLALTYSLL